MSFIKYFFVGEASSKSDRSCLIFLNEELNELEVFNHVYPKNNKYDFSFVKDKTLSEINFWEGSFSPKKQYGEREFNVLPHLFSVDSTEFVTILDHIENKVCVNCGLVHNTTKKYLFECDNCKKTDTSIFKQLKATKNQLTQKKRKETSLEIYGVEHPYQSKNVQEKAKATNIERYGVENPLQNEEIKAKSQQTTKERYGNKCYLGSNEWQNKQKEIANELGVSSLAHTQEAKEKRQQTNLEKFGSISPFGNSYIQAQIAETNIDKFGVANPMQSAQIQEKIKHNNLINHGVEYTLQRKDVQEKTKETNLEKFGVECAASSEHVKNKRAQTNLERFGVEHVLQNSEIKNKVEQTMIENHGVKSMLCFEDVRKKGQEKVKELYGEYGPNSIEHRLFENFGINSIPEFQAILINEVNSGLVMTDLIKKYKISYYTLMRHEQLKEFQNLYREKYPNNTEPENYISKLLLDTFGILTTKQKSLSFLENNYREIDIFSEEYKVAIEFNGYHWHNDIVKSDLNKAKLARDAGYKFLALNEVDLLDESRLSKILNIVKPNKKSIGARKCEIKELSSSEVKDFLNLHHLQESISGKINLGLFFNDELIQVMNFGKPRFSNKYQWELLRLASHSDYTVQGGSKKLWKYFTDTYLQKNEVVVSYCDVRYFSGEVYKNLGFENISHSFSYVWLRKGEVLQRYQTQKHKLKDVLGHLFDENLTEAENMNNAGWIKVNLLGNDTWTFAK